MTRYVLALLTHSRLQTVDVIANQITMIDWELFREIPLTEFIFKQRTPPPRLTVMVEKFNQVC